MPVENQSINQSIKKTNQKITGYPAFLFLYYSIIFLRQANCSGKKVHGSFGIKKVGAGESRTFEGAKEFMEAHGVEVVDLEIPECRQMMEDFIEKYPEIWNEDLGE